AVMACGGASARAEVAPKTPDKTATKTADKAPFDAIQNAFDRIHADYPRAIDDWNLVEGALSGIADMPALQARAARDRIRINLLAVQTAKQKSGKPLDVIRSAFDQARTELRDDRAVAEAAIGGMLRSIDTQSSFVNQSQLVGSSQSPLGGTGLELRKDG